MFKSAAILVLLAVAVAGAQAEQPRARAHEAKLADQVRDRERAFARTMAERSHEAFVTFLADEAVFVGQNQVFRGKAAVAEGSRGRWLSARDPCATRRASVSARSGHTAADSNAPVLEDDRAIAAKRGRSGGAGTRAGFGGQ